MFQNLIEGYLKHIGSKVIDMEIKIIKERVDDENCKFNMTKPKNMTWLEVIGVLEVAKKDVLDSMTTTRTE